MAGKPAAHPSRSAQASLSIGSLNKLIAAICQQSLAVCPPHKHAFSLGCLQRASAVTISSMRRDRLDTVARGTASLPTTTAWQASHDQWSDKSRMDVFSGGMGSMCCLHCNGSFCIHNPDSHAPSQFLPPHSTLPPCPPQVVKRRMAWARFLLTRPPGQQKARHLRPGKLSLSLRLTSAAAPAPRLQICVAKQRQGCTMGQGREIWAPHLASLAAKSAACFDPHLWPCTMSCQPSCSIFCRIISPTCIAFPGDADTVQWARCVH